MTIAPVIIKRKHQSQELVEKNFKFTPDFASLNERSLPSREAAWRSYSALPFPTTKEEAWRRTDLANLPVESFSVGRGVQDSGSEISSQLLVPIADGEHGGQIIINNGRVTTKLDKDLAAQGVIFTDLKTAWQNHPEIMVKYSEKLNQEEKDKFAALATAMAENGILLYVPKFVKVASPLHSLLWVSGENLAHFSKMVILLDEGSEVTYVHESASSGSEKIDSMHSGIMDINVGPGATLRFVELQSWGENIWNFTHERVNVERDGNIEWIFGALGSKVTKNFSDLNLVGEGSTGKVSGFYFTHGKQHLDHDTQQNHLARNTTSDLLYKGALVGESRSVWQGMIYVAKNASETDGYQANRNLLLSENSRADSIPGLEILTDDVRCTHGATVGKIDPEELFYLESRGLPHEDAERLIVEGFFDPIMQRIPFEGVRNRFQRAILEKLGDLKSSNT
jgi:Fe-S cluster assembly protein SufD